MLTIEIPITIIINVFSILGFQLAIKFNSLNDLELFYTLLRKGTYLSLYSVFT